jgi:hypothetical protein
MGVLEVEIMFIAPDEVNLKLVDGCTGTILLLAGEFKNGAAKFDYSALSAIYLHSCQMGESTFCICLIEISVQMFGKLPLHFFQLPLHKYTWVGSLSFMLPATSALITSHKL